MTGLQLLIDWNHVIKTSKDIKQQIDFGVWQATLNQLE